MMLVRGKAPSGRGFILAGVACILIIGMATGACAGETAQESSQIMEDITVSQAREKINQEAANPDFVILDVSTPEQFADGHIENAENMDFNAADFESQLKRLDRAKTYVIYSRNGRRSASARDMMKDLGFEEVYNVVGGIVHWQAGGLPTVR